MSASSAQRVTRGVDRLLTPDRLLVYPITILIAFLVVWSIRLAQGAPPLPDYRARWTAGRMLLYGRDDVLYDLVAQSAVQEQLSVDTLSWFVSPPPVALALIPFGALPYPLAAGLWTLLSMAALLVAARLVAGMHPGFRPLSTFRGAVMAVASLPFLELLGGGQDTAFFALALAVGAWSLSREQDLWAGLAFSVFIGKPQLAILLPVVLLVFRRWRLIAWAAGFSTLWVVLSTLVLGGSAWLQWLGVITSSFYRESVSEAQAWKMVTVRAFLHEVLPAATPRMMGMMIWIVLAVIILMMFVRSIRDLSRALLPAVLVGYMPLSTLLITPHAPVYELVLAIPGLCLAVVAVATARTRTAVALAFVLTILGPSLHLLGGSQWPLRAIGAVWVIVPMALVWLDLGTWLSRQRQNPAATEHVIRE